MKIKKSLIFLAIILASICLFSFSNKANAATISNDGKYSLLLSISSSEEASIDGEYAKIVRFNIAEGETTVKLSELTKGIVPFNGKTEFSHWETINKEKASEELKIEDFTTSGNFYKSTGEEVTYTNGLRLIAKFSDKELKDSGPLPSPVKPRCSSVVAFTLTLAGAMPRCMAMFSRIRSI